uniref:Protein WAVE n=1 Tax=Setaria digitata TaxID=48799 RepID=A0A915PZ39_9BILA
MFILVLCRWYNTLRPVQKEMQRQAVNLATVNESEEENEQSDQKQQILLRTNEGGEAFTDEDSIAFPEVAEFSDLTSSRSENSEINSDREDETVEYSSDYTTPYESVQELEQRTSDEDKSAEGSVVKGEARVVEGLLISGNVRKRSGKSSNSFEAADIIKASRNTVDGDGQERVIECVEQTDFTEQREYYLRRMAFLSQMLQSPAAAVAENSGQLADLNAPSTDPLSLHRNRTELVSESSGNSNFPWPTTCSAESSRAPLPFPSNPLPFLMLSGIQQSSDSYAHDNAPFYVDCSEVETFGRSNLQGSSYASDVVSLPLRRKSSLNNHPLFEESMDANNSEFGGSNRLSCQKLEISSEQFDHELDTVAKSVKHDETCVNATTMDVNVSCDSSFYDAETFIHLDFKSAVSNFGSYVLPCQNNMEDSVFAEVPEFKEQIYDSKAPDLIPDENDLFISCYDALFENKSSGGTPLIILTR